MNREIVNSNVVYILTKSFVFWNYWLVKYKWTYCDITGFARKCIHARSNLKALVRFMVKSLLLCQIYKFKDSFCLLFSEIVECDEKNMIFCLNKSFFFNAISSGKFVYNYSTKESIPGVIGSDHNQAVTGLLSLWCKGWGLSDRGVNLTSGF